MAAVLPLALSVGATAIQGISAFQQASYQAAVAKNNAKIAAQNADRADYASQIDQMRSDREYAAQEGSLLAAQSASGLDVLGVSQVAARRQLASVRGEQALDINQQGLQQIRNFQQQQANYIGEERAANTQKWMGAVATAFDIGGTIAKSPQGKKAIHSLIGG